jgi:hypothetical protein
MSRQLRMQGLKKNARKKKTEFFYISAFALFLMKPVDYVEEG